jgi:hypothetical protein
MLTAMAKRVPEFLMEVREKPSLKGIGWRTFTTGKKCR